MHITDRFIVIPFNNTFTDNNGNRDINIGEKLCKEKALQIIATRAVQAFNKVLQNGKFTIPKSVEEETNKYFMECNNALEFCNLLPINCFISKMSYYKEYCKWCNENHNQVLSHSQFGKQVLALGYRAERYSIKGVRNTYYVNPNFDNDEKFSIYESYTMEKETNSSKKDITFDKYLCQRLYWEKMLQDMQNNNNEEIIELEQTIPEDEMFDFDKPLLNEEEKSDYLMKNS